MNTIKLSELTKKMRSNAEKWNVKEVAKYTYAGEIVNDINTHILNEVNYCKDLLLSTSVKMNDCYVCYDNNKIDNVFCYVNKDDLWVFNQDNYYMVIEDSNENKTVDNAVIVDNVSTEKNINNAEISARGCDMKNNIVVEKTSNKSIEWDNNFYNMLSNIMKNSKVVTFYPHKNTKDFSKMRNSLVVDTSLERVIENNSVELTRELNKKEFPIYNYMSELVTKGLLNVGYQFGIKRFNTMFIKWDNGKATAKSNVIPTATDINNACKHFYKYNAEKVGFMPIVRMNNDGAIIIDCVSYIPNFYSEKVEKKSTVSRDKILDKIGKSINDLNSLIRENVTSGILTSDDITSIIKALETIGKNSEVKIDIANIA